MIVRLKLFSVVTVIGLFFVIPHTGLAARDGGYDVTSSLWAKAILQVPGSPVTLIWREVGADITPSGDQVISGYFYADPNDFAYGSQYNPEVFVKIYIATSGWCNIAFNHVTVDAVTISSAHQYTGVSNQAGTATLTHRLVEHQYNGVTIQTTTTNTGGSAVGSSATGYTLTSGLWAQTFLQPAIGPVTLIWKEVGSDNTPSGDRVVSGYFYASPDDFAYGSAYNPEVFVKIYIATNGWANIAFNHVTVDNVTISSAHNYSGQPDQSGTATLSSRLLEHTYEGVTISDETELAFDFGTLMQSVSQVIDSAGGGSVALDGAVLKIDPGILSEGAEIALYAISVPTEKLPDGDGAYGGQTLLSDTSYIIGVDRDVTLSGPITLTLPIDVTKLPSNVQLSQLHISTVNGGTIIPQGTPDAFDVAAGTMTFSFSPPFLRKDFTHQAITQPPLAVGFPFLWLVAKWVTIIGNTINPVIATVDDISTIAMYETYTTYNTDHFNITYRRQKATIEDVADIAIALEDAYDLFVSQMTFSLPNYLNLDFQYTVYLDDFKNHYILDYIAKGADGVTLPGSVLFEGASYVNTEKTANKWVSTAVHEYFHALQYGVIGGWTGITPNVLQTAIYPESSWLFEGSATALSGRVLYGKNKTPARDTQLGSHLAQGKSLFDPDQDPAADVAQDFFYFLEQMYGNVTFYRPMFEALGLELVSEVPSSISAADQVLRESPPIGAKSLSEAWCSFIKDMAIKNNDLYGGNITAETSKTLAPATPAASHSQTLPPLSYYIVDLKVQKLDPNQPTDTQPRDVNLNIALSSSDNLIGKAIIDAKKGNQRINGFPKETPFTGQAAFEETIEELRTEKDGWIRVVIINDALDRPDSIGVTVTAEFAAVPVCNQGDITISNDTPYNLTIRYDFKHGISTAWEFRMKSYETKDMALYLQERYVFEAYTSDGAHCYNYEIANVACQKYNWTISGNGSPCPW